MAFFLDLSMGSARDLSRTAYGALRCLGSSECTKSQTVSSFFRADGESAQTTEPCVNSAAGRLSDRHARRVDSVRSKRRPWVF